MSKLQTLINRIQELEIQVQELTRMLHEIKTKSDPIYFEKEIPIKSYTDFSEVRRIGKMKEEEKND